MPSHCWHRPKCGQDACCHVRLTFILFVTCSCCLVTVRCDDSDHPLRAQTSLVQNFQALHKPGHTPSSNASELQDSPAANAPSDAASSPDPLEAESTLEKPFAPVPAPSPSCQGSCTPVHGTAPETTPASPKTSAGATPSNQSSAPIGAPTDNQLQRKDLCGSGCATGISIAIILVIAGAIVGGYIYVRHSMRKKRPSPKWPMPKPHDDVPPLPWPKCKLDVGDKVHFCVHDDDGMPQPGGSGMGTIVDASPGQYLVMRLQTTSRSAEPIWVAAADAAPVYPRDLQVACHNGDGRQRIGTISGCTAPRWPVQYSVDLHDGQSLTTRHENICCRPHPRDIVLPMKSLELSRL